jgi:hypothetical protein
MIQMEELEITVPRDPRQLRIETSRRELLKKRLELSRF